MCEDDGQSFERAHVGATANLVEACREAGVGKIIHISALGARTDSPVAYLKTKWQAEDVIESSGIPFTILQPSLIFGERDRLTSHLVALLRFSPLVPVLGHDDAKVQPVWVGDVCMAVLRALNDDSSDGRTFQLGGPASMSFAQIVETVQKITGARAISVPIPPFIASAFVKLGEQIFDDPPLHGATVGVTCRGRYMRSPSRSRGLRSTYALARRCAARLPSPRQVVRNAHATRRRALHALPTPDQRVSPMLGTQRLLRGGPPAFFSRQVIRPRVRS